MFPKVMIIITEILEFWLWDNMKMVTSEHDSSAKNLCKGGIYTCTN